MTVLTTYEEKIRLAKDPSTPGQQLALLAKDEYWKVRYWVAKHPNCPPEALIILAKDEDDGVRYWVAEHPNCPFILALSLLYLGCVGYRKRKGF